MSPCDMHPSPCLLTKNSSKIWLARQFRDEYVKKRMANPAQYRSRSAFKLLEMDAKYKFLDRPRPSSFSHPRLIVDLGAAPGGWSQVVALKSGYAEVTKGRDPLQPLHEFESTNYGLAPSALEGTWSDISEEDPTLLLAKPHSFHGVPVKIIALDLISIRPIRGVISIQADFLSPRATDLIRGHFPRDTPKESVDVILSDMAANATGNPVVDAQNSLRICEAVYLFAKQHLSVKRGSEPGGVLVLKHFMHQDTQEFRKVYLQKFFRRVIYAKPPSSRSESSEGYWICIDWLGYPLHNGTSSLRKGKDQAGTNSSPSEPEDGSSESIPIGLRSLLVPKS